MIAFHPSVTRAFTDPVPPGDRLSYWDRYNASALIGLRTSSQAPSGLIASQTNAALPAMGIAEIRGNAHTVARCPRLVDIPVAGLDAHWGIRVDDLPLKIVPADGVGAALGTQLRRTLQTFLHAPTTDSGIALPACAHTVLRTMAQTRLRGADMRPASLFHVLAAKIYIARHLGDPELCPADAAREAGISVRHLNRLFALEDSSLSAHIWAQRTAMARRDLLNVDAQGATIGEIAFRWGFSSQAHFSRAIAAAYGASPSTLRKKRQCP